MTAHISDELPRLLTGEASREAVLDAAEHLRGCVDCQHELVSAVVAHASLTSAHRFAPEVVALPFDLLAEQPIRDEDGSEAESRDRSDDDATRGARPSDSTAPALPDLSDLFVQVRKEAAAARPRREPAARRSRQRYLLAGAAAAVVIAGGGGALYAATSGGTSGHPPARTVHLAAFDKGRTAAKATITGSGDVSIDASSLPQLAGKRYEVWLTDGARKSMQPVGWLGSHGTARMTVPTDLLSRFTDIEVSVQPLDAASYDYSGTSVLRGDYS